MSKDTSPDFLAADLVRRYFSSPTTNAEELLHDMVYQLIRRERRACAIVGGAAARPYGRELAVRAVRTAILGRNRKPKTKDNQSRHNHKKPRKAGR